MASIVGPVLNIYGGEPTDGVDGWRIAMNTSLAKMDAVISLSVKSRSYSKPVSNVSSGDRYLVMDQASWDSQPVGTIAVYGLKPNGSSGWNYYTPIRGMLCYVINEDKTYRNLDGNWSEVLYSSPTYTIPSVGVVTGLPLQTITGAGSSAPLDILDYSLYASTKYIIQAKNKDTGDYQSCELMAFYYADGQGNAEIGITEYARVIKDGLSPFIYFSVDNIISAGQPQQLKLKGTLSGSCSEAYVRIMKTMVLK